MIEANLCATGMRSLLLCWRCRPLIDPWLSACQTPVLSLYSKTKETNQDKKKTQTVPYCTLSYTHNKCIHTLLPKISQEKNPQNFIRLLLQMWYLCDLKIKTFPPSYCTKAALSLAEKTFVICKPFWKLWVVFSLVHIWDLLSWCHYLGEYAVSCSSIRSTWALKWF